MDRNGLTAPAPAALEVLDVSFVYPDGRCGLDAVSLRIDAGERVAVLGPNGAGKTTLALHLNATHRPRSGRVLVGGLPAAKPHLKEIRRRVGVVFQDPDDQLFMPSVIDDVRFGPANLGLAGEALERASRSALAKVGMLEHAARAPHHLSFGERRKVAIATVLAMVPDVLVLDEPSSNLDPASRRELAEIVPALELTLVVVTHDLPYAFQLCERAVVMDRGRIIGDGPVDEVLSDDALMARARLELPFGFDLARARASRA